MVCTANIARSPLLAALLQDHADRRLGRAVVTVGSAGTDARVGDPAAHGSRRIAESQGLLLNEHRSMPVMAVPTTDLALVITMSRRHRSYIQARHPALADRTFTLRELLALVEQAAADDVLVTAATRPGQDARKRLEQTATVLHAHRPLRRPRRRHLDVPDPIGGGQAAFDAMGEELKAAAERLADTLFGDLG